jgi:hypothetical protein
VTPTFDEQKREAIAAAKHLVKILNEMNDESPSTTPDERRWLEKLNRKIEMSIVLAVSINESQQGL